MRRWLGRVLVFAAVGAALVLVQSIGATAGYTDPTGDAKGGAPDITSAAVSDDADTGVRGSGERV